MKDHVRLSNQIQEWLQKYFPEYLECYAKYDSASGITLLEEAPLPEDILRLGVTGIVQVWRDRKCRKVGLKKAKELLEAAQESVGIPGGEAARLDISILVTDYQTNLKQLERVEALLEEDVRKVPNVEKLLAIKGVGLNSVEGFLAEVGDIGRFTDPKQIQKLAGLEITKISSGKRKGQPGISKRGRAKLRCVMYELARAWRTWDPAVQEVYLYYRNRLQHPLNNMQTKIVIACKAIRVFYTILRTGCDYDQEKMRDDIRRSVCTAV